MMPLLFLGISKMNGVEMTDNLQSLYKHLETVTSAASPFKTR